MTSYPSVPVDPFSVSEVVLRDQPTIQTILWCEHFDLVGPTEPVQSVWNSDLIEVLGQLPAFTRSTSQ